MKYTRRLFLFILAGLILHYAIWGFMLFHSILHPIGFVESPSDNGRTHYLGLRPFSNNFVSWWDISIPVVLEF